VSVRHVRLCSDGAGPDRRSRLNSDIGPLVGEGSPGLGLGPRQRSDRAFKPISKSGLSVLHRWCAIQVFANERCDNDRTKALSRRLCGWRPSSFGPAEPEALFGTPVFHKFPLDRDPAGLDR
jgi:hypothetical protein